MIFINVMTAKMRNMLSMRRRYERNSIRLRAEARRRYQESESIRISASARAGRWQESNSDKHRKKQQRYYGRNIERLREARCFAARKRKSHKLGCVVHFSQQEWRALKRQYGFRCVGCWKTEIELKALGRILAPDHIIPLSKGGLDDITNIQPLCHGTGGCNNRKGAKYRDFLIS
jgi:5-methylcytosine-specific restriction endonuclease McrA